MDNFQGQKFEENIEDKAPFLDFENNQQQPLPSEVSVKNSPLRPRSEASGLPAKTVMWSLAVLGCISLIFGGLRWFTSLRIPFALEGEIAQANINASNTNQTVSLLELKQKDTDGDGLNDYDELNLYKTSPYLPDTDSDGTPDGVEVQNSTDPNCPTGQDCSLTASDNSQAAVSLPASADNLTADQLRSMLLQAGLTQEQVNAVDDATLKQMYAEVLQEKSNTVANVNTNSGLSDLQPATDASNYSAAQIRQMLKEQGVTDEQLKNISDEQLLQGWKEIASQTNANTN